MKKKITRISFRLGSKMQNWSVPRGFGVAYREEAERQLKLFWQHKPGKMIDAVIDMMALIGYGPTRKAVADWDLRRRVEAIVYATNVHLRAGDNIIRRHPELPWLRDVEPWQGPPAKRPPHIRPDLWGAFAGPTPTPIEAT